MVLKKELTSILILFSIALLSSQISACNMALSSASGYPGDNINLTLFISHETSNCDALNVFLDPDLGITIHSAETELITDELVGTPTNTMIYNSTGTLECQAIGVIVDLYFGSEWPIGINQRALTIPISIDPSTKPGDYYIRFLQYCTTGHLQLVNSSGAACVVNVGETISSKITVMKKPHPADINTDRIITTEELVNYLNRFTPSTPLNEVIEAFIEWLN